jgi:hypothetical protein
VARKRIGVTDRRASGTGGPAGALSCGAQAEFLTLQLWTVDRKELTEGFQEIYAVHPEPGKPDHFVVSIPPSPAGRLEPVLTYWSGLDIDVAGVNEGPGASSPLESLG